MFVRKWIPACFAITAVSIAAPVVFASAASTIKAEIQSIYKQADAAASRKDINGAVAFYADPRLQASVRQGISSLMSMTTSAQFVTRIISVDVPKDNTFEATVVVNQHFQGLIKRGNRIGVAVADAKVRQFWTKQGNRWGVLRSRVLSLHRTLNGQAVNGF